MAAKTLTLKQQQVKELLDQGKTPSEIAKKLGMTDNNVYQHIRRMGASKSKRSKRTAPRKRTAATRTTAKGTPRKRTAPRKRPPTPTPAPPTTTLREMTPLQAVRHRRQEIETQVKESSDRLAAAEKAYNAEKDAHAKIEASRAEELKQLAQAEAALTGKKVAAKNGSGSKSRARAAVAQTPPAAPPAPAETPKAPEAAPEPVEPPTGDEALAAVGATPEQERPGVETLEEFQPGPDPFDGDDGEGSQLVGGE